MSTAKTIRLYRCACLASFGALSTPPHSTLFPSPSLYCQDVERVDQLDAHTSPRDHFIHGRFRIHELTEVH